MIKAFTTTAIMDLTEKWLITGELTSDILAEQFVFSSPFWARATKKEFIQQFGDATTYKDTALSKIKKFDPIIKLKSEDDRWFSIVIQYHTENGSSVYESLLGCVDKGQLIELRSIYDLQETKHALNIK